MEYNMIDLQNHSLFLNNLKQNLDAAHDSPFWKEKLMPAVITILDVLQLLDKQGLLINPEGKKVDSFTLDDLKRWFDLVSLKSLLFTLDESNIAGQLKRSKLSADETKNYQSISIDNLAKHLHQYGISLKDELDDFPNRFYVQHMELGNMLQRLA